MPAALTAAPRAVLDLPTLVDRDRRVGVERIIEVTRWIALVFAAIMANFPYPNLRNAASINILLGAWGIFNFAVTVALLARRLPGARLQYCMTGLDIGVASALVYLTGGFQSNFAITFFVVVVATSLRYGIAGSLLCAAVAGAMYAGVGAYVAGGVSTTAQLDDIGSHLFVFFVVALTSGLLARELVTARARQMAHTFHLEHAAFIELREVDRLKAEFIMLASHELRTPLAKVKAWLMLMHDAGGRLPEVARKEAMEVLRSETEHLARLTDNLLCIAQLEAGEIRLKTAPTKVSEAVEQVFARFVEAADRRRFVRHIDPEADLILADRERLALALACLVDNALKFSPEGELVHIDVKRQGDVVRIDVVDNGRRIPDDQVELVFASFYQVESPLTRQRGGAGVGLYLARHLVERMGGRIWVENARARGNTFAITLPAA
ncbi:MAG: hypothetical protein E6J14_03025 [Chloroflexi bacterium]|nr:MAG: hypothetical protein E6J14_03025 [Chloroflexota bacterium]